MIQEKYITAQRIADYLTARNIPFEEKKMFGGICILVDDKMLAGANRDNKLLVRVDPEIAEKLMDGPGTVELMDHSGRSMHGFLYVHPDGFDRDADLAWWLDKCLEYNPKAKGKKKK